jgi:hypothetical protein
LIYKNFGSEPKWKRFMLFLMRIVFWLALIVLLLPSTHEDNQRLIASAKRTAEDLSGFCTRNPEVCQNARYATYGLLQKVQNGVEMLEIWLGGSAEPGPKDADRLLRENREVSPAPPAALRPRWQDTLTDEDRRVPWRGPENS